MSFPPGFSTLQGFFERLLAQAVHDDVVVAQDLFEIVLLVVDDDIRAEALHQIDVRGARRRRHGRADVLGELDCKCSHAAGAGVDEDFLSLLQVRSFDQRLPGGQADQRDGSRFFHGERLRLDRHVVFVHRDEFRESTDPILMRPRIDLVAGLESPHARSDLGHDAGHIVAQDERQAIRQDELELSAADFGIQRVHAGGVDPDQDVIVPQLRFGHFAEPSRRPSRP